MKKDVLRRINGVNESVIRRLTEESLVGVSMEDQIINVVQRQIQLASLPVYRGMAGGDLRPGGDGFGQASLVAPDFNRFMETIDGLNRVTSICVANLGPIDDSVKKKVEEHIFNNWDGYGIKRDEREIAKGLVDWVAGFKVVDFQETDAEDGEQGQREMEVSGDCFYVDRWKIIPLDNAKPRKVAGRLKTDDGRIHEQPGARRIKSLIERYGNHELAAQLEYNNDGIQVLLALKYMGVIEPEEGWKKFRDTLGVSWKTMLEKMMGVADYLEVEQETGSVNERVGNQRLENLVRKARRDSAERGWEMVQGRRSILVTLYGKMSKDQKISVLQAKGVWQELTEVEREALIVGTDKKEHFLQSREIAEMLGISQSKLIRCWKAAVEIIEGKTDRYVDTKGVPMTRGRFFPLSIILLSKEVKDPIVLSVLNQLQREIWEFITIPDESGCYHTMEEIELRYKDKCSLQPYLKRIAVTVRQVIGRENAYMRM